jgi:phosphoribosylformylglycinamidine synthase
VHGQVAGTPAAPDLASEKTASDAVRRAISAGVLDTAHDLSGGGLAVALAEMTLCEGIGAEAQLLPGGRQDVALFGEVEGVSSSRCPRGASGSWRCIWRVCVTPE